MRSDARANRDHLLATAAVVIAEQGAQASLRDIARRAGVVTGTLYRHFPTREHLLDAVLRTNFDQLSARAVELAARTSPREAFTTWMLECYRFTRDHQGVTEVMMTAMDDPSSALHASCSALRAAGADLLRAAQSAGAVRPDVDPGDQFAVLAAAAWSAARPAVRERPDRVFDLVMSALLVHTRNPATSSSGPL